MNLIALLTLVRDILKSLKDISVRVAKSAKKVRLKKAIKKVKEEGDQRGVEESLSGQSGNPTKHEYDGLHTQPAKKRNRSVVD